MLHPTQELEPPANSGRFTYGPFTSRETAALEARSLARFQAHTGRESEVLVPDTAGKYWVIWSSAHDKGGEASFVPRRVAG